MEWYGCYKKNYGLWCEESAIHPAKMSYLLCYRILDHLKELGLLDNQSILDPFGGVGTTALVATSLGMKAVLVELEGSYCQIIQDNIKHAEGVLGRKLDITLIQGDSRDLSSLLPAGGPYIIVTSPPYEDMINSGISGIDWTITKSKYGETRDRTGEPHFNRMVGGGVPVKYGDALGQIGKEKGDAYYSSMFQIYKECLKISDAIVVVTKNPTRDGRLKRLDLLTKDMLEKAGWNVLCYHKAMLFSEVNQVSLAGDTVKKPRGYMGIFKRLHYNKGVEIAQHEDVLFLERGKVK